MQEQLSERVNMFKLEEEATAPGASGAADDAGGTQSGDVGSGGSIADGNESGDSSGTENGG